MNDQNTLWQQNAPTTPAAYSSPYSNPYESIPIPPPPPPTPKRPPWWLLTLFLVIAVLLSAALGLAYELSGQVRPTPIVAATPTSVPTQLPAPTPTAIPPTPTPVVIVETATPTPSAKIVPYTASEIFNDFQAAGLAMSNIHTDNSWCHQCDYVPAGGAIAWDDWGGTSAVNTEIATFATTHAMLDDAHTLESQGFHRKYQGRCLLFYGASTLTDINSYTSVMQQYCY